MAKVFKQIAKGLVLKKVDGAVNPQVPDASYDLEGALYNYQNKLKSYLDGAIREIVTADQSQLLQNKKLEDSSTEVVDSGDNTKKIKFDAAGTTGTSSTLQSSQTSDIVLTLPDITDTLVSRTNAETLTNKTLNSPKINENVVLTSSSTDLNQLDGVSVGGTSNGDIVTIDGIQTLTNKTLTAPSINGGIFTGGTANVSNKLIAPKTTTVNIEALARTEAAIYYSTDDQRFYGDNGTEVINLGGAGVVVKATVFDPVSAALPVGATYTIDGHALVDGDLVLFTNLAVDNNRLYEVSGVGVSLVFTPVKAFDNELDPDDGDLVVFQKGDAFAQSVACFDIDAASLNWKVNETVRYFTGASYWEVSGLKNLSLPNNTTTEVFSVDSLGSENIIVEYSILRNTTKELGRLLIGHDSVNATITRDSTTIGDCAVEFVADINAGDIRLQATTDNSGAVAQLNYFVRRWSDSSSGGPTGVPNYGTGGGSSTDAAGAASEIQFRGGSDTLDADTNLQWNTTDKAIEMNGLQILRLSNAITLNDNQVAASTLISYAHASYKFAVVEYSIERNSNMRVGRLLIPTNGTTVVMTDDSTSTDLTDLGITLSSTISGANVLVQYVSTNTGFSGTFKYTVKRWS